MRPLTFFPLGMALMGVAASLNASAPCQVLLSIPKAEAATYTAAIYVSATCPASRVFRVRKSSTLNVKRDGAPYQPIKPLTGAWEVSRIKNTIPREQLSSLNSWQWQWWTGTAWTPIPIGGDL